MILHEKTPKCENCRSLLWAFCLFSILGCSYENDVAAPDYKVNVLGCYFPMPSHYVLNARTDELYFYDNTDDGFGSIDISEYDEEGLLDLLDISDVLGREEKEGRVAMLIAAHLDGAPAEGFQSAIFHDYDRMITMSGDEVPNWRTIFNNCLAAPLPNAGKPVEFDARNRSDTN